MTMTLLLPWFPIVLAVGVGGHLLTRPRATAFAVCCALFWVALTQAAFGPDLWTEPSVLFALAAGSVAILAMGVWAGREEDGVSLSAVDNSEPTGAGRAASESTHGALDALAEQTRLFEDWLAEHGGRYNPWPMFGEFVRAALHTSCGASHVRAYRIDDGGAELVPLREADPLLSEERLPARRGVAGYVVTTGTSYFSGDAAHGALIDELAEASGRDCAWCFPVSRGTQRAGVVMVGHLNEASRPSRAMLRAMERLIGQFWRTLDATTRCEQAERTDPVSGLPMRGAFLTEAERSVTESYQQGEPVAVAIFAIEGLRSLTDRGQWEEAERLTAAVARTLVRKLRADDRVGRFDGSRFIVLLRRVDSELATLIVNQLMSRLEEVFRDERHGDLAIRARCGLAGSGTERTGALTLTRRALEQGKRARDGRLRTASDLGPPVREEATAETI